MTIAPATDVARDVLSTLSAAFAAGDPAPILEIFADDVLFLGGAAMAHGHAQAAAYTTASIEHIGSMVWDQDQVWTVLDAPDLQVVVAIGEMTMKNGDCAPYRVTLMLRHDGNRWRIHHFHGSTPSD